MRGGPRGSPNRREGGPVQRAAWTALVECEGQSFQRHLITGHAAGAQGSGWGLCPTKSRTRWPSIQRWSPRKRQIPRTLTVTSFTHQMLPRCVTAAPVTCLSSRSHPRCSSPSGLPAPGAVQAPARPRACARASSPLPAVLFWDFHKGAALSPVVSADIHSHQRGTVRSVESHKAVGLTGYLITSNHCIYYARDPLPLVLTKALYLPKFSQMLFHLRFRATP